MSEPTIDSLLLERYQRLVQEKHPNWIRVWPVLSGYDCVTYSFGSWWIVFFTHTGKPTITSLSVGGSISQDAIGFSDINASNLPTVRSNLERHLRAKPEDAVVIVQNDGSFQEELKAMLARHERAMGLVPMKIFLSHKGADKPMVLEFYETLKTLGFDPWLDEKAMPAGTNLQRGIFKGFQQSCAAIFFITNNFEDSGFLATEVDYAVQEKLAKGDRFAIITIVIGSDDSVPNLLKQYVWKKPDSQLGALREILRALPVSPGPVHLKQ
ncbi:MAG: toll/interleukin-1 receptor domain-containing protein [Fimbriimonadaceae bacterium]|nr:toll/interleukin-1 receptor domain-containing protein [Fimbriimonadaceae bacterium]QYK57358.1 MAG: toll/interleukin-1 receptor domain-containing protein [Fimbriimonadaceae bacterium]